MKATNKDLLLFSVEPGMRKTGKPFLKPRLKVLGPEQARAYSRHFTLAKQYDGGREAFSKGWLYAFVGGDDASGFISLGFDGSNSFLFSELRFKGKTIGVEEGLCNVDYDSKLGRAVLKDKRKRLEWRGAYPDYEVDFVVSDGSNELRLKYSFQRIRRDVGDYRGVFEEFGSVLSYWLFGPASGRLEITAKGDLGKLGYAELKPLVGKVIESNFGYVENVRLRVPFVSMGWHWSVLACQEKPGLLEPDFVVGFMDAFYGEPSAGVPFNYQLYSVDLKTGEFNVYGDAEVRFDEGEVPMVRVSSADGALKLVVQRTFPGKKHDIKGKRLSNFLETANIDYRAYPSVGVVTLKNKEFKAIGTSELVGVSKGYWL